MITEEYIPSKYKFQVLLSVYNAEPYIARCLESLNESLSGYDWILVYGDDQSEDDSTIEMARYARQLNCDKVHLFEFDKAKTVGQAKNRLIKEAHNYKKEYPYILFMDADDEMLPGRPKLAEYIENKNQYAVGSYERLTVNNQKVIMNNNKFGERMGFGPWATVFHCDFFQDDGLFPEDEVCNTGFEDIITWHHLKEIKNIDPIIAPLEDPVHRYIERNGSTSKQENVNYQRNLYWGISKLIKENQRDVYTNPLSRQEAEESMNRYIESKKQKNTDSALHPLDNV